MNRIVCVITLLIFFFTNFRLVAFAQKYGQGKYGSGDYNVGDIYTVVDTTLTSGGVDTNLGEVADPSAAADVYFEKVGYGKIEFNSTLDLTDPTVTTWLQDLDSKLDMSIQNQISLDADTVKSLIDTQAVLTMYNVTLNDPKILVNSADDSSGVVSGLVYDRTAHTLTFTAAHFTTFTAVERSSGSSSSNSNNSSSNNNSTPVCNDTAPGSSPKLFQVDLTSTSATLNFVPAISPLTYYYIAFGSNPNNMEYGTQFNSAVYPGVQKVTVNALKPNTKYYFKIRGGNGCTPGNWSSSILVRTALNTKSPKRVYYSSSKQVPESYIVTQTAKKSPPKTTLKTKAIPTLTSDSVPVADPVPTAVVAPPFQKTVAPSTPRSVSNPSLTDKINKFFSGLFSGFGKK
jgi:hypothetical protein